MAPNCKHLELDTCPNVGSAPQILTADPSYWLSDGAVWGVPTVNAKAEKHLTPWFINPSSKDPDSSMSTHRHSNGAVLSISVMACNEVKSVNWTAKFEWTSMHEIHQTVRLKLIQKQTVLTSQNLSSVQGSHLQYGTRWTLAQVWSLSEIKMEMMKISLAAAFGPRQSTHSFWCVPCDPSACFLQVFSTCHCNCV